jgi:gas vesicle protein
MSRSQDVLVAFAAGAAAGAAAALLFAPEKGEVTRKRLQAAAADLNKKSVHLVKDARETIQSRAHEFGGTVKHQVDAVRDAIQEGKEVYQRELEHAAG